MPGLRLLERTGARNLLVPDGWTPTDGRLLLLPDGDRGARRGVVRDPREVPTAP